MTATPYPVCLPETASMVRPRPVSPFARRPAVIAVTLLALAVGGCARQQSAEKLAQFPDNFEERHPIVLGDVRKSMDVFLAGNGGLDHRQSGDVRAFVDAYRKKGKGPLIAALPAGAPHGAVQRTLADIRKLAGSGSNLRVSGGESHPTAASIRLSYSELGAKVVSECGQWPHDLAGGSTLQSWTNKPYHNLGCSYQTMMAAQVADPVDHVRGRPESDIDVDKRLGDIEQVRKNSDPTTKWPQDSTKINSALQ